MTTLVRPCSHAPALRSAPGRQHQRAAAQYLRRRLFARAEPGPGDAEHDFEQREQRRFRAPATTRHAHGEQARNRELHDAEQRQPSDVVRRRMRTAATSGSVTGAEITAPISTAGSRSTRPAAALQGVPVDRPQPAARRARPACRTGAADRALTSWPYIQAMPAPATTMAIQVRGAAGWPSVKRASKRREQRRDRHRDQHVGDRGQRDAPP